MSAPAPSSLSLVAGLFVLVAAGGCAINPATGKRQLMLVSEGQELQLGRENDTIVAAEMGLYDDPDLADYVAGLGKTLAALSERPQLEWTFRVVDDPVVNAFALPGGYIYITRGILAHFNSEAELVSVLGHEIGHVTARHSASQMSKTQLAQLGLGVGSILAPEYAQQFGALAESGLGVLFLKFSRDDERQADELGLRYLLRAGYDPRPMADVFDTLERVSQGESQQAVPGWMSTHPQPGNRRETVNAAVAAMQRDFSAGLVHREEFLDRIDGIVFGEDPRQGYFSGDVFYHPEMRFKVGFPSGWKTANLRAAVVARPEEQNAVLALTLANETTATAALDAFLTENGLTATDRQQRAINGLTAAGCAFSAQSTGGVVRGKVAFVEHGERVFRLLGYGDEAGYQNHGASIGHSLSSFGPLTERRYLDVEPQRLKRVKPTEAMTVEALGQRHGSSVPARTLELINHLESGQRLEAGRSYKIVVGGKLP